MSKSYIGFGLLSKKEEIVWDCFIGLGTEQCSVELAKFVRNRDFPDCDIVRLVESPLDGVPPVYQILTDAKPVRKTPAHKSVRKPIEWG